MSLEYDYLYMAESKALDDTLSIMHGMVGLKKKWYIESLIVVVGLRGGVSYYVLPENSTADPDAILSGGADLILGLEYYVMPEFSVYLNAFGRYFGNPLDVPNLTANAEMAAQANLGVRLGF